MPRRWRSSLHVPDAARWRSDAGYSAPIASALHDIYDALVRRDYLFTADQVIHVLHQRMSERQRLHLLFVLASALGRLGEYRQTASTLEAALAYAARLPSPDPRAIAQLLYLRAQASRDGGAFTEATKDYTRCLDVLYTLGRQRLDVPTTGMQGSAYPDFELDVLLGLTIAHFLRGRLDVCALLLDRADSLLARVPVGLESAARAALTLWTRANLERWMGSPWQALHHVEGARECYAAAGEIAPIGRLSTVMADVTVDCVQQVRSMSSMLPPRTIETSPRGQNDRPTPSAFLDERVLLGNAERQAQCAIDMARQSGDQEGEVMALLALGRVGRQRAENADRLPIVESCVYTARHLDDTALLIQALSALGDELAQRNERTSALNVYQQVIAIAEQSETPVMARWAKQAVRGGWSREDG